MKAYKYVSVYENEKFAILRKKVNYKEYYVVPKQFIGKNPLSYMSFKTKKQAIEWIEEELK